MTNDDDNNHNEHLVVPFPRSYLSRHDSKVNFKLCLQTRKIGESEENSYDGFDANVRFFRHFNSLGATIPNKLLLSLLYSFLCIMMDMSGLIPLSFLPDSTRFVSIQQPGYSNVMTTSLPRPKATQSVMVAQETVTQPRTHATRDDSKSI